MKSSRAASSCAPLSVTETKYTMLRRRAALLRGGICEEKNEEKGENA